MDFLEENEEAFGGGFSLALATSGRAQTVNLEGKVFRSIPTALEFVLRMRIDLMRLDLKGSLRDRVDESLVETRQAVMEKKRDGARIGIGDVGVGSGEAEKNSQPALAHSLRLSSSHVALPDDEVKVNVLRGPEYIKIGYLEQTWS
jgi:hypothetical protein